LTCLSKAGQPDYKPADRFINRRPVYKPVRFAIEQEAWSQQWHGANYRVLATWVYSVADMGCQSIGLTHNTVNVLYTSAKSGWSDGDVQAWFLSF